MHVIHVRLNEEGERVMNNHNVRISKHNIKTQLQHFERCNHFPHADFVELTFTKVMCSITFQLQVQIHAIHVRVMLEILETSIVEHKGDELDSQTLCETLEVVDMVEVAEISVVEKSE